MSLNPFPVTDLRSEVELMHLLHMRSKCINSTSGRKSVTINGINDINFLYDVEISAVRRCFLPILAIVHCTCAVSTVLLLPD